MSYDGDGRRGRALTAVGVVVALVAAVLAMRTVQVTAAVASPRDVDNLSATGATGYTQSNAGSDGNVTTYTLGGTGQTRGSPAVATMSQHASGAVTFSPNGSVSTGVLDNDTANTDGAPLDPGSERITEAAAHGSTTIDPATGAVTYQPARHSGTGTFTYQVCDSGSPAVCGTATVTVTVANTVTAVADTVAVAENGSVTTDVLANDTVSAGGAPLDRTSVTITSTATNGTVSVNATTGKITYTPTTGFTGSDSYTYRVCDGSTPTPTCASATVTVDVGNNTVSANDDSAATVPGTSVRTDVRANDSSATGQPLGDPVIATAPTKGLATVGGNGSVTYLPAEGTSGTDSYGYQVCDTSTPAVCDTGTVTVTVTNALTVSNQSISVTQNHTSGTDVLADDTVSLHGAPLDPASLTITAGPTHGTATADPLTGVITYNPDPDYVGPDSFTYQVCDTSTPTPVCASATISVSVTRGVVTAAPESPATAPGSPVTTDVLADASSSTGHPIDPSSLQVVRPPTHGTATIDPATRAITYTPAEGFSGTDSYDYQICDSGPTPVCATATVTVMVANTVTAVDDTAAVAQNGGVTTDVLVNDTTSTHAAPLDPGSVTVTTAPTHGSTTVDPATGGRVGQGQQGHRRDHLHATKRLHRGRQLRLPGVRHLEPDAGLRERDGATDRRRQRGRGRQRQRDDGSRPGGHGRRARERLVEHRATVQHADDQPAADEGHGGRERRRHRDLHAGVRYVRHRHLHLPHLRHVQPDPGVLRGDRQRNRA